MSTAAFGKVYFENNFCYGRPPANDDFADALILGGASGSTDPIPVDCATVQPLETIGSCAPMGVIPWQTLWYSWTAPANGTLTIDTIGTTSNFPDFWCAPDHSMYTVLTVYTGVALGALAEEACNDQYAFAPAGTCYSQVDFAVTNGTTYMAQISTEGSGFNDSGDVIINWSFV